MAGNTMVRRNIKIVVSLFMVVGFVALFMFSMHERKLANEASVNDVYEVKVYFDNIGGLKKLSPVTAAGVKIGSVINIEYDSTGYQAVVTLAIQSQYDRFPTDTAASILTLGLLGEQYISFEPGADEQYLSNGAEIDITQSALILEQIIGQLIYSKAND